MNVNNRCNSAKYMAKQILEAEIKKDLMKSLDFTKTLNTDRQ